jgi:hypothetical protein
MLWTAYSWLIIHLYPGLIGSLDEPLLESWLWPVREANQLRVVDKAQVFG